MKKTIERSMVWVKVKYVSAAAPGSGWDICREYEVGMG